MAHSAKVGPSPAQHTRQPLAFSVVTLASWRLRRTWFLLLITLLGTLAAVMVACAVPLFAQVTETAGLHTILDASPTSNAINVTIQSQGLSSQVIQAQEQQTTSIFQQSMGNFLAPSSTLQISSDVSIAAPKALVPPSQYQLTLLSTSTLDIKPHIQLLQGQFPQASGSGLDILVTPQTATALGLHVGTAFSLVEYYATNAAYFSENTGDFTLKALTIPVHVVGFFHVPAQQIGYWHGNDFNPSEFAVPDSLTKIPYYTFLAPGEPYISMVDQAASSIHQNAIFSEAVSSFSLTRTYKINSTHVTINQVGDLSQRLSNLQGKLTAQYGNLEGGSSYYFGFVPTFPYINSVNFYGTLLPVNNAPDTLAQYSTRIALLRVPLLLLTIQIVALVLIFVSIMINLLVERQAEAIALLRSRGASSNQIFGALLLQGILLGLISLIIGPLLAFAVVFSLTQSLLTSNRASGLLILTRHPQVALLGIGVYALAITLVVILTMALSLRRTTTMDVLSMRRQAARNTHPPFWRRLNLDLIAALIALIAYGVSLYLTSANSLLDANGQALIITPLTMLAPLFLVVGLLFLFLRLYPLLLQWVAHIATRGRGAASMLAFAQVARTPQQSMRMVLLLALAVAFTIFSFVFTASQQQRTVDIASYETGADISGNVFTAYSSSSSTLGDVEHYYRSIHGVLGASAGLSTSGSASNAKTGAVQMEIRGIDANTFGNVGYWTSSDSSQPLSSLMAQLVAQRATGIQHNVVPVFVDALAAQKLGLHVGSTFTIATSLKNNTLPCKVLGIVQHIPTVNDNNPPASQQVPPVGGVLLDFHTYDVVYQAAAKSLGLSFGPLPVNYIWLHTSSNPTLLANVRSHLSTSDYALTNAYDRRAIVASMRSDPLYINLAGTLLLGTIIALVLAVIGDLLASLLNVRTRLTSFVVLRALGTSPSQLTGVLLWEQVLIYITAFVLGTVIGTLLCFTLIPNLLLSSIPVGGFLNSLTADAAYAIQTSIPMRLVVPLSLSITFLVLLLTCLIALGLMIRTIARPTIGQQLRVNED